MKNFVTSKELLKNLDKLHSTNLGICRIKKNLSLDESVDVLKWCVDIIKATDSDKIRRGKNWYITAKNCTLPVNASSYTIRTAHRLKSK